MDVFIQWQFHGKIRGKSYGILVMHTIQAPLEMMGNGGITVGPTLPPLIKGLYQRLLRLCCYTESSCSPVLVWLIHILWAWLKEYFSDHRFTRKDFESNGCRRLCFVINIDYQEIVYYAFQAQQSISGFVVGEVATLNRKKNGSITAFARFCSVILMKHSFI